MEKKRPYVFIGSSAEGLENAKAIQANLEHCCESHIWSQGVFGLGEGPMESLIRNLGKFDFAVLVLTPDDTVTTRGIMKPTARDNVVFELGLFIGRVGRERTFMVCERNADMKLPSDLTGIEPATFVRPMSGNLQSALGAACTRIENVIRNLGTCADIQVSLEVTADSYLARRGEEGVAFTIKNVGTSPVPPYHLCIYHPRFGTWSVFPSEILGELLPHQEREHRTSILLCGEPEEFWARARTGLNGSVLTDADDEKFVFRVVLEHSDKVLYENRRIGRAFVRIVRRIVDERGLGGISVEEWIELRSDT